MLKRGRILWFLPLGIWLAAFLLYPTLDLIRLSFADTRFITDEVNYSLEGYRQLLGSSEFYGILWITFIFVIFSVFFQMFCGFCVARLIKAGEDRKLRGTLFVRTAVLTGWVIPGVVVGIVWNLLLTESTTGILNYWAHSIGFGRLPFLSNPNWALVCVTIANIWRGTAASMIMQYAGLKTLPEELHEASVVDGASFLKETIFVTIPAMKGIIFTNLVLITISTVNTFDSIIALTGGGPGRSTEVLALSVYLKVFQEFNLGRGAATAVVLLAINLGMTLLYSKMIKTDDGEVGA